METIKILGLLILNYVIKLLIPALGLIALLCAGNTPTFILGLLISIISFKAYTDEHWLEIKDKLKALKKW